MQRKDSKEIQVGSVTFGNHLALVAVGGVCSIESEALTLKVAEELKAIFKRLGIGFVFKASFDKANRSSIKSWRGLGVARGLEILGKVKSALQIPVLTDIHAPEQAEKAAKVADILQIPAFLCRQTDLLAAAAKTGKPVNVKKGQFLSPWECANVIEKVTSSGNEKALLTERGYLFGYNNLVVDMRSLEVMKGFGYPVIYDATHSQQLPGGLGTSTGGQAEFIFPLTRAAVAVGVAAVFFETHPNPEEAKSDGRNSLRLDQIEGMFKTLVTIDRLVKGYIHGNRVLPKVQAKKVSVAR